ELRGEGGRRNSPLAAPATSPQTTSMSILILAYGNPLCSDDGIGWRAAEELSRTLSSPAVDILTCQQLTPDLAAAVSLADAVFFVDASREGQPGEISCVPISAAMTIESFTHHGSPGAVLAMAQRLYGSSPRAFMISLTGERFEFGDHLSPKI